MINAIEKEIMNSGLGFNPTNNGDIVIINVPALTEDRRKDLVKQARSEAEDSRIGIRGARKDAMAELKKMENGAHVSEDLVKDEEKKVQDLTDKYIARIDELLTKKEAEIMTV
jgi:ribosome recycling factor